jgi:hypothetical protein
MLMKCISFGTIPIITIANITQSVFRMLSCSGLLSFPTFLAQPQVWECNCELSLSLNLRNGLFTFALIICMRRTSCLQVLSESIRYSLRCFFVATPKRHIPMRTYQLNYWPVEHISLINLKHSRSKCPAEMIVTR